MKLTVTQEHIDYGVPGHGDTCAIALALHEATGETWVVDGTFAEMAHATRRLRFSEPARQFVLDYDAHKPVKPATFLLWEYEDD